MKELWICLVLLSISAAGCKRPPASASAPEGEVLNIPTPSLGTLDAGLARVITERQERVRQQRYSAGAWGELGQALHGAEFLSEAKSCYSAASRLEPKAGKWIYLLGLLQLQDEPSLALTNLATAARLLPNEDAPRLSLGKALFERGRFREAALEFEGILSEQPEHAGACLELARVRVAEGDGQGAVQLLEPCLTNRFTARPAHLLLSQAKFKLGDTAAATQLSQAAAGMEKPFDWPNRYLSEVQAVLNAKEELSERANSQILRGEYAEAERTLGRMFSKQASDPNTLLLLGRLRLEQRRCKEAEVILRQFLSAQTNSVQGWMQLGLARYCLGQWSEAAEAFRRCAELKPDFAEAHANHGLAQARLGRGEEAIAALEMAIRLRPGDARTHGALAEEHWRLGRLSEATKHAEAALRIDPHEARALRVSQAIAGR